MKWDSPFENPTWNNDNNCNSKTCIFEDGGGGDKDEVLLLFFGRQHVEIEWIFSLLLRT